MLNLTVISEVIWKYVKKRSLDKQFVSYASNFDVPVFISKFLD